MEFLWTKDVKPNKFKSLDGDKQTEVLIIGGGIAGILCAMQLQNEGIDYILVEGRRIGEGITKGTTAVLTAQHDILYKDMINQVGKANSQLYLEANLQAVNKFRKISRNIECDFEEKPSIIYSLKDKSLIQSEVEAVNSLGFSAEFITKIPLDFKVAGAIKYPAMAQFHPLKFIYGVAGNLNIYENTFVEKIDKTTAITNHGIINAKKIIIATHFPFINSHGLYFMKLYQKRSFVIALENAPQIDCTLMDVEEKGVYLRNYKDLLLVGGGDNRTGKNGEGFSAPRNFAKIHFPNAKEKYAWANQDCVSLDDIPYIGRYSDSLPNVYVASGFNLWGMTTSMVASEILVDMVCGRKNKYASVFKTDRSMIKSQLFSNMGTTLLDFVTPTTKRCSHLGCALKWNSAEHSWDCPCHGSRFDEHGKIIDNPGMKDSNV